MISCRAVSDLVRFFPVLGLLFVELNLGRVSSPELVQLLVKAGSREQHPDGKDAKRGNPYGLSVGDNELKDQVDSKPSIDGEIHSLCLKAGTESTFRY